MRRAGFLEVDAGSKAIFEARRVRRAAIREAVVEAVGAGRADVVGLDPVFNDLMAQFTDDVLNDPNLRAKAVSAVRARDQAQRVIWITTAFVFQNEAPKRQPNDHMVYATLVVSGVRSYEQIITQRERHLTIEASDASTPFGRMTYA